MENEIELSQCVKFNYILLEKFMNNKGLDPIDIATDLGISESSIRQYIGGTRTPSMLTAINIAEYTDIPLDLLFITERNKNTNIDIDKILLPNEITDNIKEYLSKKTKNYIVKTLKENKENKYKRILNSLFDTKIDGEYGKEPFMQMFAENVLNILVCAKLNDTTFMDLFAESANKLSIEINKYKIQPMGNKDIDSTFQQIVNNSNEIKGLYENTKEKLHNAIDTILQSILENEFDAIKPNTTLF